MRASTGRSSTPIIFIALGILLILGALYLIYINPANQENPQGNLSNQEEQVSGVSRVSLEEAKTAFDTQEAVFLDVRDSAAYLENHIPGAVSIPLTELEARFGELDPKAWIITYCT
jgi:3-mercaptopyruvate sulfurtransferase SseA